MKKIKDLPSSDRPREKFIQKGADSLSNSELLAVILGSGTRSQDVISISEKLFPNYSRVFSLLGSNPKNISKELGIPLHHSLKISAIFALFKRLQNTSKQYIFTPSDVFRQYMHIANQDKEYLIGIYLNSRNMKVLDEVLTIGTINENLFPINEILSPAITNHASSIIVIHNHPSGDTTPSDEDISMTQDLQKAAKLFNIELLDHVIISVGSFYSFSEHKIL